MLQSHPVKHATESILALKRYVQAMSYIQKDIKPQFLFMLTEKTMDLDF